MSEMNTPLSGAYLPTDEAIPIGRYGSSNVGRAKSVYRMGLGHRYGRRMQTICGIHYNWSLPDVNSDAYFGLIRNFRRQAFLLLYLFGASPAVCAVVPRPSGGRKNAAGIVMSREMVVQSERAHATAVPTQPLEPRHPAEFVEVGQVPRGGHRIALE